METNMNKNDVINLVNFLFENNTQCEIEAGLVIYNNSLKAIIKSVNDNPELVSIKIREGLMFSAVDIISEVAPVEELKDLIVKAWNQLERSNNKKFIFEYGESEYKYLRNSYIAALMGEQENDRFNFELISHFNNGDSDRLEIILREKSTGVNSSAIFYYNDDSDTRKKSYGAAIINANAIMKIKNPENETQYKWRTEQFSIFIPSIDSEKYNLKLSVNKPYTKDNLFSYLTSKIKEESSKKTLLAFELQNDLQDNNPVNKKLKI
jgi:hypothetical protein